MPYISLRAPAGRYAVGCKKYHWTIYEKGVDAFYTGKNQQDYSAENLNHCQEMMANIYYPSDEPFSYGDPYCQPVIAEYQKMITNDDVSDMTEADIASLEFIRTYIKEGKPVAGGNFPVIIFCPGVGSNVDQYSNVISQIVSEGYIVVATNVSFVSKAVEYPDGRIVSYDAAAEAEMLLQEVVNAAEFSYQKIITPDGIDLVFSAMDKARISIMGHSLGADVAIIQAFNHPERFNAVIAMDPPARFSPHPIYATLVPPVLYFFSEYYYDHYTREEAALNSIELTPQGYVVRLPIDSSHNTYGDLATISLVNPAIRKWVDWMILQGIDDPLMVGGINGFDASRIITSYCDNFLQAREMRDVFGNGGSILYRGPQNYDLEMRPFVAPLAVLFQPPEGADDLEVRPIVAPHAVFFPPGEDADDVADDDCCGWIKKIALCFGLGIASFVVFNCLMTCFFDNNSGPHLRP